MTLARAVSSRGWFVSTLAVAAVLVSGVPPALASADDQPPVEAEPALGVEPADDPFYSVPQGVDLAAMPPGHILRIRPLTVTALRAPVPVEAWQLLVRSTDSDGDPVQVATSIILPIAPYLAGDHRPLLSYQIAIDALGDQCQPSYTLRDGSEGEFAAMAPALVAGWAVVTTDFEGPKHAYGAGPMAGHGVLDGIRAALAFGPAGLDSDESPVGLLGYSGGGQATTWAAELHGSYAPELNLVGIAGGGVPVDLNQVARHLDGAIEAGVMIAAAVGIDREFPDLDLAGILNARGRAVVDEVSDQCIEDFFTSYPGVRFADLSDVDDPLSLPRVVDILKVNSLAKAPPVVPFYLWHSVVDQLIPVAGADQLAHHYCTRGTAPVFYDRNANGEHIAAAVAGAPAAYAFLAGRFAGLPAPDNCAIVPLLTGAPDGGAPPTPEPTGDEPPPPSGAAPDPGAAAADGTLPATGGGPPAELVIVLLMATAAALVLRWVNPRRG